VVGFDCSGLALWAWAQVGVYLPHYTGYQYLSGRHIAVGDLLPGDLVFWAYSPGDPGTIHHVAIYLGGGRVVQAPQSGDVVRISTIWYDGYLGGTRPGG
jgi:cell wall-associated NlpC family hydrolase